MSETIYTVAEQMAEAIREWKRAKREREEWKPVPGMVPPDKYLNNAKKANVLLTQALEGYDVFQQSVQSDGLKWCDSCQQNTNDDYLGACAVCHRRR